MRGRREGKRFAGRDNKNPIPLRQRAVRTAAWPRASNLPQRMGARKSAASNPAWWRARPMALTASVFGMGLRLERAFLMFSRIAESVSRDCPQDRYFSGKTQPRLSGCERKNKVIAWGRAQFLAGGGTPALQARRAGRQKMEDESPATAYLIEQ